MSREINTLEDLRREFKRIQRGSVFAGYSYTQLTVQALVLLLEQGAERPAKKKRPLTAWQKFMTAGLREGLGLKEISRQWQEQKRLKKVV